MDAPARNLDLLRLREGLEVGLVLVELAVLLWVGIQPHEVPLPPFDVSILGTQLAELLSHFLKDLVELVPSLLLPVFDDVP